jgi:SEC-C motif-containing protein
MRSRYAAFAVGNRAYLLATWHPSTRPAALSLDANPEWTRLEIIAASGGPFDVTGTVEFRAHYREGGTRGVLHERSRFERVDGRWYYVDGGVQP